MTSNACPSGEDLAQYVCGKLDDQSAEALESHLLECDVCAKTADTLIPNDDVTAGFAEPIKAIHLDHEVLSAVMQRARGMVQASTLSLNQSDLPNESNHSAIETINDCLSPPQQEDEIGRLGGYRILDILGEGGMGIVFRAEDPKLKRSVALKILRKSTSTDGRAKTRFMREAQSAAAIEHDNVVAIHQVGEDNGIPFIAMPLLKGESLKNLLHREKKLPEQQVIEIGLQICAGLSAAHKLGVVHRDIKPDNLWIEQRDGRLKILDFGLARMNEDSADLTQSATVVGTPRYMAPEQAAGEEVDQRSDLFSLGSVLYHLVSGSPAFNGDRLTTILLAVSQAKIAPVAEVAPHVSPQFCDIIERLMSKEPEDRFQSANDVARALLGIPQQELSDALHDQNPSRRRYTLIGTLGLAAILCAAAIVIVKFPNGKELTLEGDNVTVNSEGYSISVTREDQKNAKAIASEKPSEKPVRKNESQQIETISKPVQSFINWPGAPGIVLGMKVKGVLTSIPLGKPLPGCDFVLEHVTFHTHHGRAANDQDFERLINARLPNLKVVGFQFQEVPERWIHRLHSAMPNLVGLDFVAHDRHLASVAKFDRLESLQIAGSTQKWTDMLSEKKSLTSLSISQPISLPEFQQLARLRRLKELEIYALSDDTVKGLAEIKSLEKLVISGNSDLWKVSENGLAAFRDLSQLKRITIRRPGVDGTVIAEHLPNCQIEFWSAGVWTSVGPRPTKDAPDAAVDAP